MASGEGNSLVSYLPGDEFDGGGFGLPHYSVTIRWAAVSKLPLVQVDSVSL